MNMCEKTYRQVLSEGTVLLEKEQIADAATDAWLLMESVASMSRSAFFLAANDIMPKEQQDLFFDMLEKRRCHMPVQYILEEAWFYGYSFHVTPAVLIPRQDTEILIEEALKRLHPGERILDVCTGSGCILLTLLSELELSGVGSDLSARALAVAEENRRKLHVNAELIESDLFEKISGSYHMILSNPPYIATAEIAGLSPEVRDHEPRMALDGMEDGLFFYRKLIGEAPDYLEKNGWLCMEIGYDQGSACVELMQKFGYTEIEVVKDLAGLDRVVLGRLL